MDGLFVGDDLSWWWTAFMPFHFMTVTLSAPVIPVVSIPFTGPTRPPGFIDQLFFEARIRLLQWGIGGNGRGWRLKIRDLRMSRGATAEAEMGYYRYMDKQFRTAKLGNEWTWQLALHPHGCMKVMFEKAPSRPCFGFVTSFECLGVLPLCCW